jgi:hypothetical protein
MKRRARQDEHPRVKTARLELGSVVMLRDDGSNHIEWLRSLDDHFRGQFGTIGDCLSNVNGYHTRQLWTEQQYLKYQQAAAATAAGLAKYRAERT